jgi:hypothetical protein
MRFRAVPYSTDSTHMVCVIVSSIPAISSVAKSIREGYKCTVFQTLAPASSFLVYIQQTALVYWGRISRLS